MSTDTTNATSPSETPEPIELFHRLMSPGEIVQDGDQAWRPTHVILKPGTVLEKGDEWLRPDAGWVVSCMTGHIVAADRYRRPLASDTRKSIYARFGGDEAHLKLGLIEQAAQYQAGNRALNQQIDNQCATMWQQREQLEAANQRMEVLERQCNHQLMYTLEFRKRLDAISMEAAK